MLQFLPRLCVTALLTLGLGAGLATAKPYKGAELYASEAHQYGRYVVRMKVARGSGILSTFFTYKDGSEQAGAFWEELDIEVFGKNDAFQWQTNIIQGAPRQTTEQVHTEGQSLADAYHTYTLEWTPTYVAWGLDGTEIRRITGTAFVTSLTHAQAPHFNIWSSTSDSWVGAFNDSILPVYQFVNYMEFYSYDATSNSFSLAWRDDFNDLNSRWGKANWTFDGNRVDFDPANVVIKDGTLVLALTTEGNTGFTGSVPVDAGDTSASSLSSASSSSLASSASSTSSADSSTAASVSSASLASSSAPAASGGGSSSGGGSTSFVTLLLLALACAVYRREKTH